MSLHFCMISLVRASTTFYLEWCHTDICWVLQHRRSVLPFRLVPVQLKSVLHVPLLDVSSTCGEKGQPVGCVVGVYRRDGAAYHLRTGGTVLRGWQWHQSLDCSRLQTAVVLGRTPEGRRHQARRPVTDAGPVWQTGSCLPDTNGARIAMCSSHQTRTAAAEAGSQYLLFKKSLKDIVSPNNWKQAIVTAIFKKGNRNKADNYRPVSLTSIIGKTSEANYHWRSCSTSRR